MCIPICLSFDQQPFWQKARGAVENLTVKQTDHVKMKRCCGFSLMLTTVYSFKYLLYRHFVRWDQKDLNLITVGERDTGGKKVNSCTFLFNDKNSCKNISLPVICH